MLDKVAYVGTGVIASAMARSSNVIHKFTEGYAYGLDTATTQKFADELSSELGYPIKVGLFTHSTSRHC